jgi:hypothetical protein
MKVFSEIQVGTATFLASPIAGSILMAHNARIGGQSNRQPFIYGVAVVALLALAGIGYLLPDRTGHAANLLLPLAAGWGYRLWYRKEQGDLLSGEYPELSKASWWTVIGIALLVVIGIFAIALGVLSFAGLPKEPHA